MWFVKSGSPSTQPMSKLEFGFERRKLIKKKKDARDMRYGFFPLWLLLCLWKSDLHNSEFSWTNRFKLSSWDASGVFVAVIILGALSERLVATKSLYKKYVLLVKVVLHFYVQPPKKLKFLIQFLILWCGQLRFSLLDLDVGFVLYSSSISQFMVVTDRKESNDFNLTITHLIFLMATLIII